MKIFISYTLRDFELVEPILNLLNRILSINHTLFIDIYHNDSINKQHRVMSELAASNLLILLQTPNIDKSKWVTKELIKAKSSKIPIVKLNCINPVVFESQLKKNSIIYNPSTFGFCRTSVGI